MIQKSRGLYSVLVQLYFVSVRLYSVRHRLSDCRNYHNKSRHPSIHNCNTDISYFTHPLCPRSACFPLCPWADKGEFAPPCLKSEIRRRKFGLVKLLFYSCILELLGLRPSTCIFTGLPDFGFKIRTLKSELECSSSVDIESIGVSE